MTEVKITKVSLEPENVTWPMIHSQSTKLTNDLISSAQTRQEESLEKHWNQVEQFTNFKSEVNSIARDLTDNIIEQGDMLESFHDNLDSF